MFGAGGADEDESEWGDELHGIAEPGTPLNAVYDEDSGAVTLTPDSGQARATLTLTLSGSPAFCDAFRARFGLGTERPAGLPALWRQLSAQARFDLLRSC